MKKFFKYYPSRSNLESTARPNNSLWDAAVNMFNEGQYIESIQSLLNYYKPDSQFSEDTEFLLEHGSIKVALWIENSRLHFRAPFLELSEKPSIALLRKISEINYKELGLSQIRLVNKQLIYKFDEDISLCHPDKISNIIREICFSADFYDDIFVENFKAKMMSDQQWETRPENERVEIYGAIHEQLNYATETIAELKNKRLEYFATDIAFITCYRIFSRYEPQGLLGSKLNQLITDMGKQQSHEDKLQLFGKFTKEVLSWSAEKTGKSLYKTKFFLPLKQNLNASEFSKFFQRYADGSSAEIQRQDFLGASLSLAAGAHYALFRFELPDQIKMTLESGLQAVAEKPPLEAATILNQIYSTTFAALSQPGMDAIMNMQANLKGVING